MMSFFRRLSRVLELSERLLRDATGGGLDGNAFERNHAFRWEARTGPGRLVAIDAPASFDLADLIGVERSVDRLVANIEQFVRGLPRNNVLLHGERGTGKSSAVKGVLRRFADRGLRLVEVQREDLTHLPRILKALRGDGGRHRFLIFCDDLSFGDGEGGFRELKAALEGSFEAPPENVCIVATSNRRHLLPESMADNRKAWLDEDERGSWEASYEPLAIEDEVHVAIGSTHYFDADGMPLDEYSNIFVCRFDDDGQCTEFHEWWMRAPGPVARLD